MWVAAQERSWKEQKVHHKVVVLGANGLVGSELLKNLPNSRGLLHSDLRIEDFDQTRELLLRIRPDLIINTAGLNNTDACEQMPEQSFKSNCLGAKNLAVTAGELDIPLVQFSTDYVFGGKSDRKTPYGEEDLPHPVNVCGISKLAGEHFVASYCPRHYIIRISAVYGPGGSRAKGGRDFIKTILRLCKEKEVIRVVDDQFVSPTCAIDLAKKVKELVGTGRYGTYHMGGSGVCSWYEFATAIFEIRGISAQVSAVKTDPGPSLRRAFYTGLRNRGIVDAGLKDLDHWRVCLERYLRDYEE